MKNEATIAKNVRQIEVMTSNKISELNEIYVSVDQRKKILQALAVDFVEIQNQLKVKEAQKERIERELKSYQKVNEIHIEIDILQSTPEGQQ